MQEIKAYDIWIEELEQKGKKLPRIQSRLVNFEVLPRLGMLLSQKSEDCNKCKEYWTKLQTSTINFGEFFDNGNNYLNEFESLVDEIMQHLKRDHQIRPKGFILSVCTLIAMLAGSLIGLLVGAILNNIKAGIMTGWMIGVIVGWLFGKNKERQLKHQNRIF